MTRIYSYKRYTMNARQRKLRAAEFQKVVASIERRYVTRVFNVIKNQLSSFTNEMERLGVEYARRRLQSLAFSAPMAEVLRDMHRTTAVMMLRRTMADLRAQGAAKRTIGVSQQWIDDILEYFRLYLLDTVTTIDETTRNHILSVLEEGFRNNWTVPEMAKAINDREYMKHRAIRIVRTESVRAANYGVKKGAEEYEFETVKEWIAITDNRTRHSHMTVNAEQREMDQPFSNGLDFPGDPNGPAKEVISCRCTMGIVPKRDSNGDLIPKSNIKPGTTYEQTPIYTAGQQR